MPFNFSQSGTEDIKNFAPVSLDEAEQIIDYLKAKPLILSLNYLKGLNSQRFLDLMCGACYALNKKICVLEKGTYLFIDAI